MRNDDELYQTSIPGNGEPQEFKIPTAPEKLSGARLLEAVMADINALGHLARTNVNIIGGVPFRSTLEADAAQYFYCEVGVPAEILKRMAGGRFAPIHKGIKIDGVLYLKPEPRNWELTPRPKRCVDESIVQGHLVHASYAWGRLEAAIMLGAEEHQQRKRKIKSELAKLLRTAGMSSTDAEQHVANFVRSIRNV